MSVRTRRPLAPAQVVLFTLLVVPAGVSHAFTLQRLAASLDVRHLAASGIAGPASTALVDEMMLAVPARTVLPASVELSGATTEVRVGVPREADMDIVVTDEAGAVVCNARVHMPAGWQKVAFSGRGPDCRPLPNGVYFYRVTVDEDVTVTRIVINR